MNTPDPVIDLYIARHAESAMNLTPSIICGQSHDIPLTAIGGGQALALGRGLYEANIVPNLVYTSSARRCLQTGRRALLAMELSNMPWTVDEDLLEVSQGQWEGLNRDAMYTPEVIAQRLQDPFRFHVPGGESAEDALVRKQRFLSRVVVDAAKHPERPTMVLAFGHGLSTRILAGLMLGWSMEQIYHEKTPNTGITNLHYEDHNWTVNFIGKQVHELEKLA